MSGRAGSNGTGMELPAFNEPDLRVAIVRALRLLAVMAAVALPFFWWKLGWQSAVLLLIGVLISGSGLWEWRRLMSVLLARMEGGGSPRAVGLVATGFVVRLVIVVAVLYGSLKLLDGSVVALAVGLGLGIVALTIEGLRMAKDWTH